MKTLNWQPVLRGHIYCSSACGHNCTKADYDKAVKTANDTIERLKTKGWVTHINENMGWHWTLVNSICGISLHGTADVRGLTYWTMIMDGDTTECSSGCCGVSFSGHHKDPNKAVAEQIKLALPVFKAQARGLDNLKRFAASAK